MKIALIRYGELTLKKKNKKFFLDKLKKRLYEVLKNYNFIKIVVNPVRAYLYFDEYINEFNEENIVKILKSVFGLTSVSFGFYCSSDLEEIKKNSLKLIEQKVKTKKNLKVLTKRKDKKFYLSSLDITKNVASYIFKNNSLDLKAKVKDYDHLLIIEVNKNESFIVLDKIYLQGGMPNESLGKGMLMLSGGIDSPVAGFLSIKKGIEISALHFYTPPYTCEQSLNKVINLLEKLTNYQQKITLYLFNITKLQLFIHENIKDSYKIAVLRSLMYILAENLSYVTENEVLINGESLGQVASQTLKSMSCFHKLVNLPIIQPVCALDKIEIIKIAKDIQTYDISISPYNDCCTLFMPKNPTTTPVEKKLLKEISKIPVDKIQDMIVISKRIIEFKEEEYYF